MYLELALKIFAKNEFILKTFWNGIVNKIYMQNNVQKNT